MSSPDGPALFPGSTVRALLPCAVVVALLIASLGTSGAEPILPGARPAIESGPSEARVCSAPPVVTDSLDTEADCRVVPSTRAQLLINLDSELGVGRLGTFELRPIPIVSEQVVIHGPDGRLRTLLLMFRRALSSDPDSETVWEMGVATIDSAPDIADSGGADLEFEALIDIDSGEPARLAFDADGRLLGAGKLKVFLPRFEAAPPSTEFHDLQKFVFEFRAGQEASTQYASASQIFRFEHDGLICPDAAPTQGACVIPSRVRFAPPFAESVETISFSNRGQLLSTQRQRVQGYALNLDTGEFGEHLSDARVPFGLTPPKATRLASLLLEFDAAEPVTDPSLGNLAFFAAPENALRFRFFDRLGVARFLTVDFVRIAPLVWAWRADAGDRLAFSSLAGGRSLSGSGSFLDRIAEDPDNFGELIFDERGLLVSVTQGGRLLGEGQPAAINLYSGAGGRYSSAAASQEGEQVGLDFNWLGTRLSYARRDLRIDVDGNSAGRINAVRVTSDLELVASSSSGRDYVLSRLIGRGEFLEWKRPDRDALASTDRQICEFACSNRLDDDGDGLIDTFRGIMDPGCQSGMDGSERTLRFACDDGRDNDGDGLIDFPEDPSCASPIDQGESPVEFTLALVSDSDHASSINPGRPNRPREIVLALLDKGGAPLEWIDEASLRLEPGSLRALVSTPSEVLDNVPRPDIDCDGVEDRLFKFRLPLSLDFRGTRSRVCLSGTFAGPRLGFGADPAGEGVRNSLSRAIMRASYPGLSDFRACLELDESIAPSNSIQVPDSWRTESLSAWLRILRRMNAFRGN